MRERLAALAEIHYGKSPIGVLATDGAVPIVGTGGVYGQADRAMFREGVVVARKGSLGNPHLLRTPFWPADTTYAVVPRTDVSIEWLYYCLLGYDLTKLNEATGVPSINRNWLAKIEFEDPGPVRQARIADILTSIDTVIDKTEALIAKYQQIKAGLMHDLFTRGVLPSGQLRPSREQAPGLYQETAAGWIPWEWHYELLDKLAHRGSGHTPNKDRAEYWSGGVKWVSLADSHRLDRLYISDTELKISQKGIQNSSAVLHPAGIVVLSRDAGVGKSAITTEPMAVSQHFMCWKCDGKMDKHFLYYWLQHKKRMFENIAMGSTILTIGLPYFKKLRIACPVGLAEQVAIAARLLAGDAALSTLESDLAKLKKEKLGLMQDLLTGKVQVTVNEVAPVPAHA